MLFSRKIYWVLALICAGSYGWIAYKLSSIHTTHGFGSPCIFKSVTTIPCPSCGVTRAVLLLFKGEFSQSVLMNPFGLLAVAALLAIPVWITYDLLSRKYSLLAFYKSTEVMLRTQKIIYIPLITLVVLNWVWNISKGI